MELPEELWFESFSLLVRPIEAERCHPPSIFQHTSSDILSTSLVNSQFRQICLPLVFSYVNCDKLGELERLKDDCFLNPALAGSIGTLDARIPLPDEDLAKFCAAVCSLLLELLPSLKNLVSLNMGAIVFNQALLGAINNHQTLKTVIISPDILSFLDSTTSSLVKIQLYILSALDSESISYIKRGMRVLRLGPTSVPRLEAQSATERVVISALRELWVFVTSFSQQEDEESSVRFSDFLSRHDDLVSVTFYVLGLECSLTKPYIISFWDAATTESLNDAVQLESIQFTAAPGCKLDSNNWKPSGLGLALSKAPLRDSLSLVTRIFPNISRLDIQLDDFPALLSTHFPNLQTLHLSGLRQYMPSKDLVGAMRDFASRIARQLSSIQELGLKEGSFEAQYRMERYSYPKEDVEIIGKSYYRPTFPGPRLVETFREHLVGVTAVTN
ncbi:hypothetical protein C8J56DRAFT_1058898 [Mycena floridula]|nr:hypothetical protein C8J56DRAFT_1058898 [Mycena floridula]